MNKVSLRAFSYFNILFFLGYIELFKFLNLEGTPNALGLTHYLSGISIKKQDVETEIPPSWTNLPQTMLQKILLANYTSRKLDLPEKASDLSAAPESCDLDSFFDTIDGQAIAETDKQVHPMDIFLFLYLSIDPLFQRKVLQKLDKCKLSLPLIICDPSTAQPKIFAFPFQSLSSEWKKAVENEKARESILFNEPMPIISFIRFGKQTSDKFSKSKILNEVIGFDHDCFIHRNSPGSAKTSYLLEGTLELSWFLPSKTTQSRFSNPITFLNLRGNAAHHLKQLNFIQQVSNKIFLILWSDNMPENEANSIREIYEKSSAKIVCLFPIFNEEAKRIIKSCPNVKGDREHTVVLGRGNLSQDVENICHLVNLHSQNTPAENLSSLATHVYENNHGIELDYNESYFKEAECEINLILRQVLVDSEETKKDPMRLIKEKYFPLQGKPWEEWSKLHTESIRLKNRGDRNLEEYKSELRDRMNQCRHSQLDLINDSPGSKFLYELLRICYISFVKHFHTELLWNKLGLELNSICTNHMPTLYQEHNEMSDVLHSNRVDKLDKDQRQKLEKQYIESAKNLSKSSLGIEHIIREFSQVYESFIQAPQDQRTSINLKLPIDINLLPKFAANLLIQGYPIEILDGDASNVPTVWLSQLLHDLKAIIGNKQLYIISILGVQSSGKSTLLNTMFGLHFAVSAGRCTKGIFMQMIPVSTDISDQLGYDYLVVLDTEGLRAPELDSATSRFHDNELATFAIGLSHLTIINIMGETPTQMEDILPITIHAFLRMKLTWIKPKCVFVHQNVTAAGSEEKLGPARAALIDKLNKMACAAAKLENKSSEIKRFSDIIDFNPQKDVLYFPTLFRGDPPMAPVNISYSNNAFNLKLRILQILKIDPSFKPKTISSLINNVTQLWNAILNENFVFHFKNVQEINASWELDNALNKWHFGICKKISSWQLEAINQLSNASDVSSTLNSLENELHQLSLDYCKEEERKILENFFETNPMVDIFIQWQQSTVDNFRYTRDHLRNVTFEKCKKESQSIINQRKLLEGIDDIERKLIEYAKQFILNHKDSPLSEKEIQESFDCTWTQWVSSLGVSNIPVEKRNISEDLYNKLFHEWKEFKRFNFLEREVVYNDFNNYHKIGKEFFYIEKEHINLCYYDKYHTGNCFPRLWYSLLKRRDNNFVKGILILRDSFFTLLYEISQACDRIFNELCTQNNYDPFFFSEIAQEVEWLVDNMNQREFSLGHYVWIEFTNRFQFDMTFYQCCRAIPHLEFIHNKFIQKYSVEFHLAQSKMKFLPIFQNLTHSVQNEVACSTHLAKIVMQGMLCYLIDILNVSAVEGFFEDNPNKYRNKATIQFSILEELCLARKFYQHLKYIKKTNYYIRNWMETKLVIFLEKSSTIDALQRIIYHDAKSLVQVYNDHAKSALDVTSDWDTWKFQFHKQISKQIKDIRLTEFDILDTYEVQNVELVCDHLIEELVKLNQNFDWTEWTKTKLNCSTNFNALMDSKLQCQACCPLCNEPCQLNSGTHRNHYCGSLHRVPAINGRRNPFNGEMSIDQCTLGIRDDLVFYVNWRKYRFREFYKAGIQFKDWRILAEDAIESKYWQWFTCQFEQALLRRYRYLPNSDIRYWDNYSQRDILLSLKLQFDNVSS